jgi:hypothetical protein
MVTATCSDATILPLRGVERPRGTKSEIIEIRKPKTENRNPRVARMVSERRDPP